MNFFMKSTHLSIDFGRVMLLRYRIPVFFPLASAPGINESSTNGFIPQARTLSKNIGNLFEIYLIYLV